MIILNGGVTMQTKEGNTLSSATLKSITRKSR